MVIQVGYLADRESGKIALSHLQLVWDDPISLSNKERDLFVDLSIECNLNKKQLDRRTTFACLRQAATSPDLVFSDQSKNPVDDLEQLLKKSK